MYSANIPVVVIGLSKLIAMQFNRHFPCLGCYEKHYFKKDPSNSLKIAFQTMFK